MKLESAPLYPVNISANGIPVGLVKNLTPHGKYQIARVRIPGGANESDHELLFEGSHQACEQFLSREIERRFPGLLGQQR